MAKAHTTIKPNQKNKTNSIDADNKEHTNQYFYYMNAKWFVFMFHFVNDMLQRIYTIIIQTNIIVQGVDGHSLPQSHAYG